MEGLPHDKTHKPGEPPVFKTQIQGLERTQKGLPMEPGQPATMTHEDKWNGTTILFAALNTKTGEFYFGIYNRHQEFIEFLARTEAEVPAGRDIHPILDNYASYKHGAVLEWLAEHPRCTFHYTPTSCPLMNAIDGFFGKLARRRVRRRDCKSFKLFEKAILEFIELHNGKKARAFKWAASPDRSIAAHQRGI